MLCSSRQSFIAAAAGVVSDVQRNLELRCVLAVVRHGDRTPKQKMKVTVTQVCTMAYYATAYCCYGWSMQLGRSISINNLHGM
jgi:hypothetical protein